MTSLGMTSPALWRDDVSNKHVTFSISACVVNDIYGTADGSYDCNDDDDSFRAAFILLGFNS